MGDEASGRAGDAASGRAGDAASARAVRGWGCTPTGELPAAVVPTHETTANTCSTVFVRSWRRTALYLILVLLIMLVCLNIGLTLWIISTLKLNARGIGPIKIVNGGIQLEGQAWVTGALAASTVSSAPAQPLTLRAARNLSVLVSEPNQTAHSKLVIKRDGIECSGSVFSVRDSRGEPVFSASRDEVHVHATTLAVDGAGGVAVRSAVQTPAVHAPYGSDLQLESLTRRLELRAPRAILLESRAGGIAVTSHQHIKLDSTVGAIKIDAPNIMLPSLKIATVSRAAAQGAGAAARARVYQLCACAGGRLFLAAPDAACHQQPRDTDLCR